MILAHRRFYRDGHAWLAIAREATVHEQRAVQVEVLPYTQEYAAQIAAQESRDHAEREDQIAAERERERHEADATLRASIERLSQEAKRLGGDLGSVIAQRIADNREAAEREALQTIRQKHPDLSGEYAYA